MMEDIGLSIFSNLGLKSNVEVHYSFSIVHDQTLYFREVFDIEREHKGSSLRLY